MPCREFRSLTAAFAPLPTENVDTDQIIPARFLTTTGRTGLGRHAFHDWRYRVDGSPNPGFVLNDPRFSDARILVAGRNFGCGSSREHAVWALLGAGIEAVVSSQFADIFRGNALGNGLLPVEVPDAIVSALLAAGEAIPDQTLTIDLEAQRLTLPDGRSVSFPIAPFAKHRLLNGLDEFDFLLQALPDIEAYEENGSTRAISTITSEVP